MALKLSYYGRTDQGLVRPANEDNLLLMPESNLFVVCDGMGGHSAGEVASRTAVGAISAAFNMEGGELADDPLLRLVSDRLVGHCAPVPPVGYVASVDLGLGHDDLVPPVSVKMKVAGRPRQEHIHGEAILLLPPGRLSVSHFYKAF
ncbi:MAG: hypothetical protein IH914_02645 [candidate division Zixibacteria bacterium]|nr:hypothetical protein [candidate division Zixibacteria bacterium]